LANFKAAAAPAVEKSEKSTKTDEENLNPNVGYINNINLQKHCHFNVYVTNYLILLIAIF